MCRRNASPEVSPVTRGGPICAARSPAPKIANAPPSAVATRPASVRQPNPPSCSTAHSPVTREHDRADDEEPGMGDRAAAQHDRGHERGAARATRERRGRREERRREHEVRDEAAAEERRPRAGEQHRRRASPPRGTIRAAPRARARRPPGRSPGRARTAAPRARRRAPCPRTPCSVPISAGAPGPLARHRDTAELGHARPPQVDRDVGADGERVVMAKGRPQEDAR